MLQRQRRFDEAMQEARQAVALEPNNPTAYDALIENLIYAGEAEEALRLVDESIRLDPNLPSEKLFLKGMAYYTLGRLSEGFSHFVTSMTAPIASDRSDSCRVGLAPTEERRLTTAHTHSGHCG